MKEYAGAGKRSEWRENLVIAALVVLALFLAARTGFLQNTLPRLNQEQTLENGLTVGADISLFGEEPVRIMLQTADGRYGVEYDQETVKRLYDDGLSHLLEQSLRGMETPAVIPEVEWQKMLLEEECWIFYDFLNNLSFSDQDRNGAARYYVIFSDGTKAQTIAYYNQEQRTFYAGSINEELLLPPTVHVVTPNGGGFAFEDPATAQQLFPYMMVMQEPPVCPVYLAGNPLKKLDSSGWTAFLGALDFNANAVSPYTTASGNVIREGADTLRIMNDGTIQFHSLENGELRYQALSSQPGDLKRKSGEILENLMKLLPTDAVCSCQSVRETESGQTELLYSYVLNGARVNLWGDGWGARFLYKGNALISYTILLRSYEPSQLRQPLLPTRQAAAAASAMGRRGAELQVLYRDSGNDQVNAGWAVQEPR